MPDRNDAFPSNTHTQNYTTITPRKSDRAENEKVAPVVKTKAKEKKKSFGEKIVDSFFMTDWTSLRDYFIYDLLIPGAKTAFENMLHICLHGNKKPSSIERNEGRSTIRRIGYDSFYDGKRDVAKSSDRRKRISTTLIFGTREDAEEVLDAMHDRITDYGLATVMYYYSLADMDSDYTMANWGWRNVDDAVIIPDGGAFILKMPKLESFV